MVSGGRRKTVLITGANRGLGLALTRQYAADGYAVVGTARRPGEAEELHALGAEVLPFDAHDGASLEGLVAAIGARPLDIVIANAGIGGGTMETAAATRRQAWQPLIEANTIAPFLLAAALRGNLEAGSEKKLVAISTLFASIGGDDSGGRYAYRASKVALNAFWRSLSIEWRPQGIVCLLLRPGHVRTRMTDFRGTLDPDESVAGMRRVIAAATIEQSGAFLGYDGAVVPW